MILHFISRHFQFRQYFQQFILVRIVWLNRFISRWFCYCHYSTNLTFLWERMKTYIINNKGALTLLELWWYCRSLWLGRSPRRTTLSWRYLWSHEHYPGTWASPVMKQSVSDICHVQHHRITCLLWTCWFNLDCLQSVSLSKGSEDLEREGIMARRGCHISRSRA